MLSWSSQQDGPGVDPRAVAGDGDGTDLPHAATLLRFAGAAAGWDDAELGAAREALVAEAGWAFAADAAAVVANFEMMTRIADGTGARHAESTRAARASIGALLGMVERP